jgi:hypothetical protein
MILVRRLIGWLAIVFGVATVAAGGRVLTGADPGYVVFLPLVMYNTAMGAAYVAAGAIALRASRGAAFAAGAIAVLNGVVCGAVIYLRTHAPDVVAAESVTAMSFRTVVWALFWIGLWFGSASRRPALRQR